MQYVGDIPLGVAPILMAILAHSRPLGSDTEYSIVRTHGFEQTMADARGKEAEANWPLQTGGVNTTRFGNRHGSTGLTLGAASNLQ